MCQGLNEMLDWLCKFNKEVEQPTVIEEETFTYYTEEENLKEQLYAKILASITKETIFQETPWSVSLKDPRWKFILDNKLVLAGRFFQSSPYLSYISYSNSYDDVGLPRDGRLWQKCVEVYYEGQKDDRIAKLKKTLAELGNAR